MGAAALVTRNTNSTEPGYTGQIPVEYGGTAVNPGSAPSASGDGLALMDFTPWLASGTDTNVETTSGRGTFGFQGDFSTLWVTAASAETGSTGRIQEGINLVSGSTVNVAAGTYDEQVVIDGESLTLQGVGDTTVIRPSSPAKLTTLYTYPALPLWAGAKTAPIVLAKNVGGAGATIKDLKVDGSAVTSLPAGAGRIAGIQYGETAGTIDNVTVTSIKTTGYADRGTGIDLSSISAVSVEVLNSRVSDSARNGIQAIGGGMTVNVHDNTVAGPPTPTGPAQVPNGIVLLSGLGGTAHHNVIHSLHYIAGDSSRAMGIMVYGTGFRPVVIEFDEIYDTDDGIGLSAGANDAIVRNNSLHNNGLGVVLEGGATNNQVLNNDIVGNAQGIVSQRCPQARQHPAWIRQYGPRQQLQRQHHRRGELRQHQGV